MSWCEPKDIAVIVGVAIVFVGGYQGVLISERKSGIIIHDQGHVLKENKEGNFQMSIDGKLIPLTFDVRNNPRAGAKWIAQVGVDRFGKKWGCSYAVQIWGDSIFKFQNYRAITAQAAGYNSFSIGVMLLRTDNNEINDKTIKNFPKVAQDITDTLATWADGSEVEFVLFHSDVATNGKEDPHEMRAALEIMGYRYDNRAFPIAINIEPYDYAKKE